MLDTSHIEVLVDAKLLLLQQAIDLGAQLNRRATVQVVTPTKNKYSKQIILLGKNRIKTFSVEAC